MSLELPPEASCPVSRKLPPKVCFTVELLRVVDALVPLSTWWDGDIIASRIDGGVLVIPVQIHCIKLPIILAVHMCDAQNTVDPGNEVRA